MRKEALIEILKKKEFKDNIIFAFDRVDREMFVPDHLKNHAYDDIALPTEEDSSLSKPSTIATMLGLLEVEDNDKILEIGSGSGYTSALLSNLTKNNVFAVEIKIKLATRSANLLSKYTNVKIICSDGSRGLESQAPFDKIIVSASANDNATLYNLLSQLKEGGILVGPVKDKILKIKKIKNAIEKQEFDGFSFLPLLTKAED